MKKTLCLILALLMLTSSFASCSNNNSDKTEDTTESFHKFRAFHVGI